MLSPQLLVASSCSQPFKCTWGFLFLDLFCKFLAILLSNLIRVVIKLRLELELIFLCLFLFLQLKDFANELEPIQVQNVEVLLDLRKILDSQAELALVIVKSEFSWIMNLALSLGQLRANSNPLVVIHSQSSHDDNFHILEVDFFSSLSLEQFPKIIK